MSHLDMWDEDVVLTPMTRELCHKLFQGFENDPDTFADMTLYSDYEYLEEKVDAYFDRQQKPDRVTFAIMLGTEIIGEVKLKDIDSEKRECCLGIHLKNNSVKGRGYGTKAEMEAVKYAFTRLGMTTVKADVVGKNVRSQHILEKIGFHYTHTAGDFKYYRLEKNDFPMSAGS